MEDYLLVLKFIGLLIVVALLAYFVIRFGLRRLQPSGSRGHIKVIQKVPLDMKGDRLLVLVHIGGRILLLGSAQGSLSLLCEFSPEELPPLSDHPVSLEGKNLFYSLLAGCRKKANSEKEGTGF